MVSWPSFHLSTPSSVPIQILPSRADAKDHAGERQSLTGRDRGNDGCAKTVEPIRRADPDVAFAILEKRQDESRSKGRQSAQTGGLSVVNMQQPLVQRSNPQSTIAIPHQAVGRKSAAAAPGRRTSPLCCRQTPAADDLGEPVMRVKAVG